MSVLLVLRLPDDGREYDGSMLMPSNT